MDHSSIKTISKVRVAPDNIVVTSIAGNGHKKAGALQQRLASPSLMSALAKKPSVKSSLRMKVSTLTLWKKRIEGRCRIA